MRIAISGVNAGTKWANVFYVQCVTSSLPSQADVNGLVTSFQAAFKTRLAPHQASDVAYSLARGVFFSPGGGEIIAAIAMTGTGSGGASAGVPASTSSVISWAANVYWRGGKPRTYLAGLRSSSILNQWELTSTEVGNLTTDATSLRTDVNALTSGAITGTTLGFVSFRSGNAERPAPIFYATLAPKVHQRLCSQRRRLGKELP
jgi:hypothetical protein